jgi:hypothetical protein
MLLRASLPPKSRPMALWLDGAMGPHPPSKAPVSVCVPAAPRTDKPRTFLGSASRMLAPAGRHPEPFMEADARPQHSEDASPLFART